MSPLSHATHSLVFDLDDTLYHTSDAVKRAYRQAGVVMPDGAQGRPWHEWLPTYLECSVQDAQFVHQRKNDIYVDMIVSSEIEMTSAYSIFTRESDATVITGASRPAALALLAQNDHESRLALSEASWRDKSYYLFSSSLENAIYIDDNDQLGRRIVREANSLRGRHIEFEPFKFIHYVGQSTEELREQIEKCQS